MFVNPLNVNCVFTEFTDPERLMAHILGTVCIRHISFL